MHLDDFIALGQTKLTSYLGRVEEYLSDLSKSDSSDRDDLGLIGSPPEKYIRNMLCLAILNRFYRKEFLKTKKRLIVLPECLKNYGPDICCKIERKNHSECTNCLADCQVNLVDEGFADNQTEMILEPEDADLMAAELRRKRGTVGIVGVACILTLVSGFKSTLRYKHPTQGLFLNYSSCGHHWVKKKPYNTRFSFARLALIMNTDKPINTEQSYDPPVAGETYSLETQPGSTERLYAILDELAERFCREILPAYQNPEHDLYETGLALIAEFLGDDLDINMGMK